MSTHSMPLPVSIVRVSSANSESILLKNGLMLIISIQEMHDDYFLILYDQRLKNEESLLQYFSISSDTTFTSASTGKKFVSPFQRGTI